MEEIPIKYKRGQWPVDRNDTKRHTEDGFNCPRYTCSIMIEKRMISFRYLSTSVRTLNLIKWTASRAFLFAI